MDVIKSTVSGITENMPFRKGTSYTIIVTAKDSSGNNIGTGGEKVYIRINNHWTRAANMVWTDVPTSTDVLGSTIEAQMIDNADGTYSYTTNLSVLGYLTIEVMNTVTSGVQSTFYDSTTVGVGTSYTNSSR
jgi:hypothetical protein